MSDIGYPRCNGQYCAASSATEKHLVRCRRRAKKAGFCEECYNRENPTMWRITFDTDAVILLRGRPNDAAAIRAEAEEVYAPTYGKVVSVKPSEEWKNG